MTQLFTFSRPLELESGTVLPGYHLTYTTLGRLNFARDNVVWVFHALTANSNPTEWWTGLVGEGKLFDPAQHFIVCVNMPGSCYGSIGPLDNDPRSGRPFYHDFPVFTTRDMIRAYGPLREWLGIRKIHIGIGGSMGGQQLLEWAVEEPALFDYIFPIATNARHSPWGIAFNASQRMAIEADPSWKEKQEKAGIEGMRAARAIALLSYRNYDTYQKLPNQDADSYQRYQGEKLVRRFNAYSYYSLSLSMDSHDLSRGRRSLEAALQSITAKTMVIGIESDILFPLSEQQLLAALIPGAVYHSISSFYGHDGFLLEFGQIERLVREFLALHRDQQKRPSYGK